MVLQPAPDPLTARPKVKYPGTRTTGDGRKIMDKRRTPLLLRLWFFITWCFAYPIRRLSQRLHSRMGAAPERFPERLGQSSRGSDAPVIWFHAASLGEVSQIGPLVERLEEGSTILVTTATKAGADWVARALPDVIHQFAPLDTPSVVSGFLDSWRISIAVFIEGDLWPRMITALQTREIPHVLLNARNSRTRQRLPRVFATLLSGFALITCRSESVAQSILSLGFPAARLKILPDLRIATANIACPVDLLTTLQSDIGDRPIWLAASTHRPDEKPVLAAHKEVIAKHPNALLILAPRHPQRGASLLAAARAYGFIVAQRSTGEPLTPETQIYLADTLGELGVFYSLAPVAFIGGSFGDEGGHNPYEPASCGTAILSGAKVKNFAEAYAELSKVGAAKLFDDPLTLGHQINALLVSDQTRAMGNAGLAYMKASKGSVSTTVSLIEDLLPVDNKRL